VTILYIKFILNGYIVELGIDEIFYYNFLIVEDSLEVIIYDS